MGNGNYKEKEVVLRVHMIEVTGWGKVQGNKGILRKKNFWRKQWRILIPIEYIDQLMNDIMSCSQGLYK